MYFIKSYEFYLNLSYFCLLIFGDCAESRKAYENGMKGMW